MSARRVFGPVETPAPSAPTPRGPCVRSACGRPTRRGRLTWAGQNHPGTWGGARSSPGGLGLIRLPTVSPCQYPAAPDRLAGSLPWRQGGRDLSDDPAYDCQGCGACCVQLGPYDGTAYVYL